MLVIFRWWYFLGIAGLGLAVTGAPELALALRASADPAPTELTQLGVDGRIAEPHVRIGDHAAHYSKGRVVTRSSKWRRSWFYYPVGQEPLHVVARTAVPSGGLPRHDHAEPELVGIAEPLDEYDPVEQAAVLSMLSGADPKQVVVIERDKHPNFLAALTKLLGSILLFAWAALRFFRPRAANSGVSAEQGAAARPDPRNSGNSP